MKLKILGQLVDVRRVDAPLVGSPCGHFHAAKNEILINSSIVKELQETTLIHEIIEALNYHLELNLEHNKITSLESGLYQVLKDNKLLNLEKYIK